MNRPVRIAPPVRREGLLNTYESRLRHRSDIVEGDPFFDEDWGHRCRGFLYTCPRCQWQSRVMKWRIGAESQADDHQLKCPAGK